MPIKSPPPDETEHLRVLRVTEQQAVDVAMTESEERHRQMLMLSPDAHFVHVDGLITFVNWAFCQLMGADDPSQLLGRPALSIAHPDYHEHTHERRFKLFSNEPMPPSEIKFVRLDRSIVDVEVASVAFDFRGHKEVQVIARDITARHEAVTALRESEERFKIVARAVSDVVWDWNLLANTLWWNDGFLTTFGFKAGEIEPSVASWTGRIHEEDRQRVVKSMQVAIKGKGETWTADYRFERKDGSHAFVHDRGFILRNPAGEGIRMVGGMRDLTDEKEQEMQQLRAQRMESIGTLAGGIAHDLNNVLAPIMLSIELLKSDPNNDPQRLKFLNIIQVSSQRGAELVRQVLSFALGQDGQRVAMRLQHLINEIEGIITETFPRNIRIVTDVDPHIAPVMGDPTQLHQVLINLAVNARDAMPDGGTLTVKATNCSIDEQYASMTPKATAGPHVLLEVTDTGMGMPPEVQAKIFDPFYTTKGIGKGTGLGLATVHSVVNSHGGFLLLESVPNQGTTFKIYLPADPALKPHDALDSREEDLPRGLGELLLVVDDEPAIREITQSTLETFGYRVITATNGAEAVALYAKQAEEISVVLTDLMMPVMDGAAMIKVLRHLNKQAKVIITSGNKSGDNNEKLKMTGAKYFLSKPYIARDLLILLREVIDRPVGSSPPY